MMEDMYYSVFSTFAKLPHYTVRRRLGDKNLINHKQIWQPVSQYAKLLHNLNSLEFQFNVITDCGVIFSG
jgi:hypothetical protein